MPQRLADLAAPEIAGLRLWLAGIRLQTLLRKANFNPAQLRLPGGQPGGGRWSNGGGSVQHIADDLPPLRRMHPDSTYESDQIAKGSLDYWRQQPTDKIIESLKPGAKEPLTVEPDGRVWQGNTRIRVLQERGYDVNSLPRVPRDGSTSPPKPPKGRGGGGGRPPGGRFHRM